MCRRRRSWYLLWLRPAAKSFMDSAPTDFTLTDNGVPQQIHVDDDMDNEPVVVVMAVEKGRMSALEFSKINRLAPLLDLFLGDGQSEAALVTFDSKPHTIVGFTRNSGQIGYRLKRLEPGDGGAAILDTVAYASICSSRSRKTIDAFCC